VGERVKTPAWVHAAAWGATALAAAALAAAWLLAAEVDVWRGLAPSVELHRPLYAEQVTIRSVFRTPANTWSNLGFLLVGFYCLALAVLDRRAEGPGFVRRAPVLSALFGLSCVYLGVGSALFHASLTRLGQQLDVAAMYTPLLALLAISAGRTWPRLRWPLLAAGWLVASVLLYVFKWELRADLLMPILGLIAFGARGLEHRSGQHRASRWVPVAAISILAALLCRDLDVAGLFSPPDAWWQGHSAWHLLCAVSLGAGYLDQRADGGT
jgi:hypothetical protein